MVQERPHEPSAYSIDGRQQIRLAGIGLGRDVRAQGLPNHGIYDRRRRDRGGALVGRRGSPPQQALDVAALGTRPCRARRRLARKAQVGRGRGKGLGILGLTAQLPHGRKEIHSRIEMVGVELVHIAEGDREWHLIAQSDTYPRRQRGVERRETLDICPARSRESPCAHLAPARMSTKIADDQHPQWQPGIRS